MLHTLAETIQDVSSGYGALIKTGIFILIAIAAFIWWLNRQT
jgi:hypothetical protein